MTHSRKEARDIRPTLPGDAVGGLLALSSAEAVPLPSGGSRSGYGGDRDCWLIAPVRGTFTVASHAQNSILDPGQALALYQCGGFSVQSVAEGLYLQILLKGELPGRLLNGRLENGAALFPRGGPAVREAMASLSVLAEEHPPVSGLFASGCAYTMLMSLLGAGTEDAESQLSPLVESAVAIIQEEFPFLEGLDELAERLEVSKAHLIRAFTEKTGVSPGKYITRVRVEYAKLLLRGEDASVAYVAEASGFANANYFAKVFRKETGMTPSEYLRSAPRQERGRPGGPGPVPW